MRLMLRHRHCLFRHLGIGFYFCHKLRIVAGNHEGAAGLQCMVDQLVHEPAVGSGKQGVWFVEQDRLSVLPDHVGNLRKSQTRR